MYDTLNGGPALPLAEPHLPDSALRDLLAGGDIAAPMDGIIPRSCSTERFNTLLLLAIAVGRFYGIGSTEWVRFGAMVAAEIGPRVWEVKYAALARIPQ